MTRTQVTTQEIVAAIDSVMGIFTGITDHGIRYDNNVSISQGILGVESAVRSNDSLLLDSSLVELAVRCLFAIKGVSGRKAGEISALLNLKMFGTLQKKGYGTFASSHEILGVIVEEHKEYSEAFGINLDAIVSELYDIAVAAIFGVASLDHLDWPQ